VAADWVNLSYIYFQKMQDSAQISLSQKIPLILSVVDKKTGQNVPNAILSGVIWHQDNPIGQILPDPQNPNLAIFAPSEPGVVNISASATITIN
jgi:hypothetical protein